jgi:crotonobetaine/carnitine-CoA ligase
MLEYWRKPAETVAAWRDLWFHTGDVGHTDEDGYLHFTGRQAHWIRRRGENVSSFEVERTVEEHHDVVTCAAVGVPAPLGDDDIKIYVQLADGATVTAKELTDFCAERVSYFKVPRYVQFVTEFPRSTAKQEIERHTLRALGIGDAWDREADGRPRSRHAGES